MRPKGFLGNVRTVTALAESASDCFHTVLEQHGIFLFPNSFSAKIVSVRERMQTFCKFRTLCFCIALKLALIQSICIMATWKGLHRFHYHVQLASINISCKNVVFYFGNANAFIHPPINPLGLIVKGLDFSYDNVFAIDCIPETKCIEKNLSVLD